MTSSKASRTILFCSILPLTLLLASCSALAAPIPAEDVQAQAEQALFAEVGSKLEVSCEDDLPPQKDATITCITDFQSGQYETILTVTSVDNLGKVNFSVKVAEEPIA